MEVGNDASSSVVVYLCSSEEQRCWHSTYQPPQADSVGNAFVSRQMTENVALRNSLLTDTIDAKNLCPRHKYDAVSSASVIY